MRQAHTIARGFTLMELLVSITIISVLIGILLPVLPRVRDAARRTVCQSNLRQIGISITAYQDKNRGEFPAARYMPEPWLSGDEDPPLNVALGDFLESDSEVYRCPGDHEVCTRVYIDEDGAERECGVSYTYTTALSGRTFEDTFFSRFLNLQPSDVPVLHDYDGGLYELREPEWAADDPNYDPLEDRPEAQIDFFHEKRSFLYADGSVG